MKLYNTFKTLILEAGSAESIINAIKNKNVMEKTKKITFTNIQVKIGIFEISN